MINDQWPMTNYKLPMTNDQRPITNYIKEYEFIPKENWEFKSECLKYLRIDVLYLFTII